MGSGRAKMRRILEWWIWSLCVATRLYILYVAADGSTVGIFMYPEKPVLFLRFKKE